MAFLQEFFSTLLNPRGQIHTHATYVERVYCPYSLCEKELLSVPQRSKKCPFCHEQIMVRTHPYTKEKSIYTEEQANVFDGDLKNYKHFRYFLESMKQFLDVNDISLLELYREHQSILRARNTNEPLCKEVVMNISNYLIAIYPNVGVSIHFQHAIFLFESGERYHHIQRNGFMLQLQEFKRRGYQKVHITTHQEKSCAKCVALDKKVLTIDQAMTKQLLPCTKCTFAFKKEGPAGWCRCSYTAV